MASDSNVNDDYIYTAWNSSTDMTEYFPDRFTTHVYPPIALVGLVLNVLLIALIGRPRIMQSHHVMVYLTGIAVSNMLILLFGSLSDWLWAVVRVPPHILEILCRICAFMYFTGHLVLPFILILLLVDRWMKAVAIRRPGSAISHAAAKFCNHLPAKVAVGVIYAVTAVLCLIRSILLLWYNGSVYYTFPHHCRLWGPWLMHLVVIYGLFSLLFLTIVATCLFCGLCCIKKRQTAEGETGEKEKREEEMDKEREDGILMALALTLAVLQLVGDVSVILLDSFIYGFQISTILQDLFTLVTKALLFPVLCVCLAPSARRDFTLIGRNCWAGIRSVGKGGGAREESETLLHLKPSAAKHQPYAALP